MCIFLCFFLVNYFSTKKNFNSFHITFIMNLLAHSVPGKGKGKKMLQTKTEKKLKQIEKNAHWRNPKNDIPFEWNSCKCIKKSHDHDLYCWLIFWFYSWLLHNCLSTQNMENSSACFKWAQFCRPIHCIYWFFCASNLPQPFASLISRKN